MTDWLESGWNHVWLPYAQMQTAPLPLPVARTQGARIYLEDGRTLIDGVASWWTACHGYNHPHTPGNKAGGADALADLHGEPVGCAAANCGRASCNAASGPGLSATPSISDQR